MSYADLWKLVRWWCFYYSGAADIVSRGRSRSGGTFRKPEAEKPERRTYSFEEIVKLVVAELMMYYATQGLGWAVRGLVHWLGRGKKAATVVRRVAQAAAAASSGLRRFVSRGEVVDRVRRHFIRLGRSAAEAERLATGFANSFDWSKGVTARVASSEKWYRYGAVSGKDRGFFLTKEFIQDPKVAVERLHLGPYGNPATGRQLVTIHGPTEVLEGAVSGGDARQAIVLDWGNVEFGPMVPTGSR